MGIRIRSCCCPGWASAGRLLEGHCKWGCWIFCGRSNWHFWSWGITSFWLFRWVKGLTGFWRCCVQHGTGISFHHEELLFFSSGFSRSCVTSRFWVGGGSGLIKVLCTLLLGPFSWAGTTVYTAPVVPGVSWTLYKVGSQALALWVAAYIDKLAFLNLLVISILVAYGFPSICLLPEMLPCVDVSIYQPPFLFFSGGSECNRFCMVLIILSRWALLLGDKE